MDFMDIVKQLGQSVFSLLNKVTFTYAGITFTWLHVIIFGLCVSVLIFLLKHLIGG